MQFIKNIIRLIKNIIMWYPILKQDENHHYGYLIFSMNYKLKIMRKNWKTYTKSTDQIRELNLLIDIGDKLIKLLMEEEETNHIRSKEYLDLNEQYFNGLKKLNIDMYY